MSRSDPSATAHRAFHSELGRMRMLAGDPALDFVNTLHWRDGRLVDFLPNYQSLVQWCIPARLLTQSEYHSLSETAHAYGEAAEAALVTAIKLREVWREHLDERTGYGTVGDDGQQLRDLLAETLGDGGLQCRIGGVRAHEDALMLALPIRRIALSITSLELIPVERRIGRCEGEPCGGYFLASSRSKPRRWCSMDTCGNRAKVRGFRGRMRAEDVSSSES